MIHNVLLSKLEKVNKLGRKAVEPSKVCESYVTIPKAESTQNRNASVF